MKLTWNGHDIRNDRFMELFGRVISKSKLWDQLLFSVSLELPGTPDTQDDIIRIAPKKMLPYGVG